MSEQVAAVKRKLVGSLNKAAIDHAVESYGYERETLEEILVLCGTAEEMSRRWNAFNATPEQRAADADQRTQFELEVFLAYVRDTIAKEKQQAHAKRIPRTKQRKRGRRRR